MRENFSCFVGVCFEWSYIQCVENTLSDELNIGTIHIHNDPNKLNAKRQGELEEKAAHCNSVSLQSLMDPSHPPFHLIDPKWCTIQSIPWIYAALWEPPSSSLKTFSRFSDPQLLAKLDGNEIQLFKICFRTERLLHFLFLLVEFVYFKLSFTFFESASRLD